VGEDGHVALYFLFLTFAAALVNCHHRLQSQCLSNNYISLYFLEELSRCTLS
jgi:hypothetical protein